MIIFKKAKPQDAKGLAFASWKAFDNDINYGAKGKGGPPGYKSEKWQSRMMRLGKYYKIMYEFRIIGGFIVFEKKNSHFELGRIFIHPDYQNQGIGARAIEFMEKEFPQARRWTLGTPRWNKHAQHFYEKMGFVKIGNEGQDGILYGKIIFDNKEM
ncbi:GNAT family N-acetyltransferase [Candidatus Poribacteria bacterium]|nr:GNAT family N-acetyltransferase [Candidatus Poribacteria bacterium]